jgi:beta-glucanase (GH16 family)
MKKMWIIMLWVVIMLPACQKTDKPAGWELVWSEEFDGKLIDTNIWSKTPRGKSNWNNTMSDADELYAIQNGNLILRGINNTSHPNDTSQFLTGGVWSKGKQAFALGRIDIRAKFDCAQGFWPAIWLMPEKNASSPGFYSELDILEHLNSDDFVYQTVHSTYTLDGNRSNPINHGKTQVDINEYNVYSVEVYPDSVVFLVNDQYTFTYPRMESLGESQFPYPMFEYYLILSAQLGGNWVGPVDPSGLPVALTIDWVRYYRKES